MSVLPYFVYIKRITLRNDTLVTYIFASSHHHHETPCPYVLEFIPNG